MGEPFLEVAVVVAELDWRFVHADLELGMMCLTQALHLDGGLPEHPVADLDDHSRFFSQHDELCGADQPARGVLPAYEGLGFVNAAAGHFDDGMIMQAELVAGERTAQ